MMEVDPELPLSAQECDVSAVDDDDVITGVVHRVIDRLVLTLQHPGDLFRRVKRILPFGIVQIPEILH